VRTKVNLATTLVPMAAIPQMESRVLSPPRTAIKRFKKGKPTVLAEEDWSALEKILGRGLPVDVRSEITHANDFFAKFGGLHSSANTVSVKAVDQAIDAWYKASGRLLLEIGSKTTSVKIVSRKKFLKRFSGRNTKRFKRLQPLSALRQALSACMGISLTVADELSNASELV
jgi:hypothetical protein